MPELPEVETVARGVDQRTRGERIESAWFSEKPEPFKTPAAEMAQVLPGRRIEAVRRVGKHIVFDLGDQPEARDTRRVQWIVHLGMTGRLLVSDAAAEVPRHTHGILRLSSGREIRFVDARRFGRMGLHWEEPVEDLAKQPKKQRPKRRVGAGVPTSVADTSGPALRSLGFRGPGTEPLDIALAEFIALFRGRHTTIKAALLNQGLLHGVGNIYADESLFRAGIRPRRMAGRLRRPELARLHEALQTVLREAIRLGGSSVSDYVDADGVRGFFQLEHRVYMRTGEPCVVCGTPIRRTVLAGRGTHFCPGCQR